MPEFILRDDREETEGQINGKPHADKRGEEGYLYKVQLLREENGVQAQAAYAKKWYRSFDYPFSLPLEAQGAALSPFWHARIVLQYELINAAFPEHSVQMIGGYDPRIQKNNRFNILPGRPTTVTAEAVADSKLQAAYDQIIGPHYAKLHEYKDEMLRRTGSRNLTNDPFIENGRIRTDNAIRELLGEDIMIAKEWDDGSGPEGLQRKILAKNPQNRMATMIEWGVHPIHPEMNFVPGNRDTHAEPPYGTFVEMTIHDLDALHGKMRQKLQGNQAALAAFERKLKSYSIYKKLDELYAEVAFATSYGPADQFKFSEEVQSSIYNLLETLRKAWESGAVSIKDENILRQVKSGLKQAFNSQNHIIIAAQIKSIAQRLATL